MFCTECEEYNVALTLTANEVFMGPIEVCIHNKWHRVCDNSWTKEDAKVTCRQLQLPETGMSVNTKFKILKFCFTNIDAVAVYFNEDEVFEEDNEQNVANGCECIGSEPFYSMCISNFPLTRPRGATEKVVGILCQK